MKQFSRLTLWLLALCFVLAPAQGFAQDTFLDSNGVRIRYVDRGAGDPVVLIHGNGSTLETWVDHLGIRRAHIVGYSMGAHITAQLPTTHPERFLTATLGGAAGRFTWGKEELDRSEQEAREKEKECISRSQIMRLVPTNGPKPTEDEIEKRSAACMADPNQDQFAQAAIFRRLSSCDRT